MPNVHNSWLCQVVDKSPNNKHINLIINYSTTEENISEERVKYTTRCEASAHCLLFEETSDESRDWKYIY